MPKTALLCVNAEGVVQTANDVAEQLLGACVGRHCCDVVAATDAQGALQCSRACAAGLGARGGTRLVQGAVADQTSSVTCSAMGDGLVVAVQRLAERAAATPLSAREQEVLGLVAQGFTNLRIARALSISVSTVNTHMERVLDKLEVRSRTSAVAEAIATGQLPRG